MLTREENIKRSNELLSHLLNAIELYRSGDKEQAYTLIREYDWSAVPEIEQFSEESHWLQLIKANNLLAENNVVDAILLLLKVADANSYESLDLHIRVNLLLAQGHRRLLDYKNCVTYLSECIPFVQTLQSGELKNLLFNIADFAESTSERIREVLTIEVLTMAYVKSKNALLVHEEEVLLEALCHRYISNGEPERARALFQSSVSKKGDLYGLSSPRKRATYGTMLLASGDVLASMNLLRSAVADALDDDPRLCVSAALAYARGEKQHESETQEALELLLQVEERVVGRIALKYEYGLYRQIALRYGRQGNYEQKINYIQRAIAVLGKQETKDIELVTLAKQQQSRLVRAKSELERIAASNSQLNEALTALSQTNSRITRKTSELVSVLELISKQFKEPVERIRECVKALTEAPHASASQLAATATGFKNTVLLLLETIKAEQGIAPDFVELMVTSVYASSALKNVAPMEVVCDEENACAITSEVQGLLTIFFAVEQFYVHSDGEHMSCQLSNSEMGTRQLSFSWTTSYAQKLQTVPNSLLDLVGEDENMFEVLLCLLCIKASALRLGMRMEMATTESEVTIALHHRVD